MHNSADLTKLIVISNLRDSVCATGLYQRFWWVPKTYTRILNRFLNKRIRIFSWIHCILDTIPPFSRKPSLICYLISMQKWKITTFLIRPAKHIIIQAFQNSSLSIQMFVVYYRMSTSISFKHFFNVNIRVPKP